MYVFWDKLFKNTMETNCYLKKWDRLYFSIATIQEYNQQLTVFFPLIELFDFCCRVSSMTKDESVRILKYSFGYLKIDFGFSKKLILFYMLYSGTIKSCTLHVTWKSINKWVERRGRLSPLWRLICEIRDSVGLGNFTFVREKSRNFGNLWMWKPWVELTLIQPL